MFKVESTHSLAIAYTGDAGYDIAAASPPIFIGQKVAENTYKSIDYVEYDTEVKIAPQEGYHTFAFPRSSISSKNLILANSIGLIDNGYRGTVRLRFKYIAQPIDYSIVDGVDYGGFVISPNLNKIYQQGDRIGQLVFAKTLSPEFSVKDSLSLTVRKEGGFGSSGS